MSTFLAPVLGLIIWTLLIWLLMYSRRIPAMQAAKIDPDSAKSPAGEWKSQLPLKVEAAAHNYNHLMEQPTIFYAFMFWAALTQNMTQIGLYLAWAYVGLRVVHSLIQVSTGPVMVRFSIFSLSTLCLVGMIGVALFL